MGMTAVYVMVDDATLKHLQTLDEEALVEALDAMEEADENPFCSIDKMWDGLHFLLTGFAAGEPVENNPLSEAIVGAELFSDAEEDVDFVAYTPHAAIAPIVAALQGLDWDALQKSFDPGKMTKEKIYPTIWGEDKAGLFAELREAAAILLDFYGKAQAEGRAVVVSIF